VTFRHIQAYVDEIVTVDDEAIIQAVRWIYDHARLVAEPSGAAAVAAVLARATPSWIRDGRQAIEASAGPAVALVSGGNVEAQAFGRYIT
jgi:threonine dehydratase